MLRKTYISGDVWLSNMEIDAYLSDPRNSIAHVDDQADVLATIGEQMATDDLVEDSFLEALHDDAFDVTEEDSEVLFTNYSEFADLCDIVEAVEKGHIIYG